tara:strand:+ start:352 stop:543 length:192 start_codon:yes stop_codon:yes gene_type:complete
MLVAMINTSETMEDVLQEHFGEIETFNEEEEYAIIGGKKYSYNYEEVLGMMVDDLSIYNVEVE